MEEEGEGVEVPGHLDVSFESRHVKCCPIIVVMLLVGKAATRERERERVRAKRERERSDRRTNVT